MMLLVSMAGLCEADSEHCRIWACTGTIHQKQILFTSQILKPLYWCKENEREGFVSCAIWRLIASFTY